MRKFLALLVVAMATFGAQAVELKRYTNLYDKIPAEGYVGFAGIDISAPSFFGEGGGFSTGITTSHGWMLRSNLFLGAGAGYLHDFHNDQFVVPIFGDARIYFPSKYMRRIFPHIGARLGGVVASEGGGGLYAQLACGFRVPFSNQVALNVEVGPQYVGKFEREHLAGELGINTPFKAKGMRFGFFGRVSIEF